MLFGGGAGVKAAAAAAARMSLHRVASRAARHALPSQARYRCVRSALAFAARARPFSLPTPGAAPGTATRSATRYPLASSTASSSSSSSSSSFFSTSSSSSSGIRGFFDRQLERNLEARANGSANNAAKQEQYLRELNGSNQPEAVIDRVHAGSVNTNSAGVALEYIKALARTDRLDRSTLAHLMNQNNAASGAAYGSMASSGSAQSEFWGASASDPATRAAAAAVAATSAGEPLLVRVAPPSLFQQIVRGAGTLLMIGCVIALVQYMLHRDGKDGVSSFLPGMGDAGKQVVAETTRFADVKGVPEAKGELLEVVEFLKNPGKFTALGGKLPKGVLLVGPPGTGKTLLAKAVAGEAGVPFFYASGSEFEEVFVGLGARRVRQLFEKAKAHAPCIIFLDEIDAVGQKRTMSVNGSNNRQTINQLLSELDGFEGDSGIIVVAATNFPESLDAALTRPGRFDRHVQVALPDLPARTEILQLYLDRCPTAANVDANVIARGTPGASGADLANIVNMAAVQASVENAKLVAQEHLEWAKDKVIMGPERKSAVMRPEDLKCTAYHETGHALVALMTPGSYPVHKATIMPRGQALGMVSQLPEHDVVSMSKKQILAKLDVLMGGRVAEVRFLAPACLLSFVDTDFCGRRLGCPVVGSLCARAGSSPPAWCCYLVRRRRLTSRCFARRRRRSALALSLAGRLTFFDLARIIFLFLCWHATGSIFRRG